MKYFVLSDIHGEYDAMIKGIKDSGYDKKNPYHQLVVIGDYFGRAAHGKGPYGVWKYLTSKTHANKPICIKGNHEEYFVAKMFERGYVSELDRRNGEDKTVLSFFSNIPNINKDPNMMDPVWDYLRKHPVAEDFEDRWYGAQFEEEVCAVNMLGEGKQLVEWVHSLPYYFETKNHVFTHGWLPYRLIDKKVKSKKMSDVTGFSIQAEDYEMTYKYKDMDLYSDAEWHHWIWVKTPEEYKNHCYYYPNGWDKWIVVGHWHAFAFGPNAEFFQNHYWDADDVAEEEYNYVVDEQHKIIFCDHCTALGHKINVVIIEDDPV